jgi:hypothetical protein
VVRDGAGSGVLAGSGRLSAVHDALAAEGKACRAATNDGISRIILETDTSNLADGTGASIWLL